MSTAPSKTVNPVVPERTALPERYVRPPSVDDSKAAERVAPAIGVYPIARTAAIANAYSTMHARAPSRATYRRAALRGTGSVQSDISSIIAFQKSTAVTASSVVRGWPRLGDQRRG